MLTYKVFPAASCPPVSINRRPRSVSRLVPLTRKYKVRKFWNQRRPRFILLLHNICGDINQIAICARAKVPFSDCDPAQHDEGWRHRRIIVQKELFAYSIPDDLI